LIGNMKTVTPAVLGFLLFAVPAWAWFAEGHEIAAVIAADDLTPAARSHVAKVLKVPADPGSVEKARPFDSTRTARIGRFVVGFFGSANVENKSGWVRKCAQQPVVHGVEAQALIQLCRN